MKFLDLVDSKKKFIGEIVQFDDGVCVLKLSVIKRVYCFDDYSKTKKYIINSLRLTDIKIIKNGILDDNDDTDDEEED